MAITIDWATQVINVPKADTQLVSAGPPEIRSLDIDTFRLTLKDLEDDEDGMPFIRTHNHNPPVTVGGVTLARVVEIINGYTITFEDGQYAVNLVGANSNIADVANVNQVSIRSANSAGLTFSKQTEDTAFADARVWVDVDNGLSGVLYPRGTVGDPVNNLADAQTIIANRTLPKRLHLAGTLVIGASDDISDYDIVGSSPKLAALSVSTGGNTNNLVVKGISITGDLNGNITATEAVSFDSVTDYDGRMIMCGIKGTIDLGAGGTIPHEFVDCYSEVAGTDTPILDCNSLSNLDVQFRRYAGGIDIRNFTSGDMSLDLNSGNVIIASTCTGGTIVVRGVGTITDNSTGTTVVMSGLAQPDSINAKLDANFAISAAGV